MQSLINEFSAKPQIDLYDVAEFHAEFERIHPFYDGNGRIGRLLILKMCLANDIVPFDINDESKMFYYMGLKEWQTEQKHERLLDVFLSILQGHDKIFLCFASTNYVILRRSAACWSAQNFLYEHKAAVRQPSREQWYPFKLDK